MLRICEDLQKAGPPLKTLRPLDSPSGTRQEYALPGILPSVKTPIPQVIPRNGCQAFYLGLAKGPEPLNKDPGPGALGPGL